MTSSDRPQAAQSQTNALSDIRFGDGDNTFNFAPVQIGTQIETQIIQIATEKVTQRSLIKASPYRGLKRFNFADRDRFFGRDALIKRLFEAVNQSSLSLVLGASGSGKSSAVRAGVIPELKKTFQTHKFYNFIFTPNDNPFESLYRCLLNEEKDYQFSTTDVESVRQQNATALPNIIQTLKKPDEHWLFFIDQFEEIFTNCGDPKIRQNFVEGLVQIANSNDSTVRLVLAMRSDFLEQFGPYPALGEILNQNNIHLVTDMHPDELRQAIEQPAAKHGVVFESGLVEQIIQDVQGQSGYLPLLQYTLDLLWESECLERATDGRLNIEDRTLNWSTYTLLEGVRGALQKRVNQIYQRQDQSGKISTKQIFLKLVNIVETDSGSRAVSRRAYRAEFVGEAIEKALQTLIDDNLLTSSYDAPSEQAILISGVQSQNRHATVELAHEILLSSWDALKRWLEEEKEAIILKNWLADETRRWQTIRTEDESKANDELLKGARLGQIAAFREKNAFKKLGGLSEEEDQFIDASIEWRDFQEKEQAERRKQKIKQARRLAIGSVGAAAVMAVLSAFSGLQLRRAEIGQIQTDLTLSESRMLAGEGLQARLESLRAGATFDKSIWQRFWPSPGLESRVLTQLQQTAFSVRESNNFVGHQGSVNKVIFNAQGLAATGSEEGIAMLWDAKGQLLANVTGHSSWISNITFAVSGNQFATSSEDGSARVWDLQGKPLATLEGHRGTVWDVAFNQDGTQLATSGEDGTLRLWNAQGKLLNTIEAHQGAAWEVLFAHEGKLVTRGEDGAVRLWDAAGKLLHELEAHQGNVWDIDLNSDKTLLVTSGEDGTAIVWNIEGQQVSKLPKTDSEINAAIFSPDGVQIAIRSADGQFQLWNWETNQQAIVKGRSGRVWDVAFSPEGSQIATANEDGLIRLWNVSPLVSIQNSEYERQKKRLQAEIHPLEFKGPQGKIWSMAFNPAGTQLASAGEDKIVRLWNLTNSDPLYFTSPTFKGRMSSPSDPPRVMTAFGKDKLVTIEAVSEDISEETSEAVSGERFIPPGDEPSVKKGYIMQLRNLNGEPIAETLLPYPPSEYPGSDFTVSDHYVIIPLQKDPDYRDTYTEPSDFIWNWKYGDQKLIDLKGNFGSEGFDRGVTGSSQSEGYAPFKELSPDGAWIATITDDSFSLFDMKKNRVSEIKTAQGNIKGAEFSPDSKHIATLHESNIIHIWDLAGNPLDKLQLNDPTYTEQEKEISKLKFSPDGTHLVTQSGLEFVQIWNIDKHQVVSLNTEHVQQRGGYSNGSANNIKVQFGHDGTRLITHSYVDGSVRLWDLEGNKLAETIPPGEENPETWAISVVLSPTSNQLAISTRDGTLHTWDISNISKSQSTSKLNATNSGLIFSPDGNYIAAFGSDNAVQILRKNSSDSSFRLMHELPGHDGTIRSVSFSSDGSRVATSTNEKTWLWDNKSNLIAQFRVPQRSPGEAFSPDSNHLLLKHYSSESEIWQVGPIRALVSSLCLTMNDYLNNDQLVGPDDKDLCPDADKYE